MKVVLFGATGMVGQGVLRECLLDPDVESVLAVVRNVSLPQHDKLQIAEEEYSRKESVLPAGDSQFPVHRQSGKANVDPVEESDHHNNEDERDDPTPHLADC